MSTMAMVISSALLTFRAKRSIIMSMRKAESSVLPRLILSFPGRS